MDPMHGCGRLNHVSEEKYSISTSQACMFGYGLLAFLCHADGYTISMQKKSTLAWIHEVKYMQEPCTLS